MKNIDRLALVGFPIEDISIEGNDHKFVFDRNVVLDMSEYRAIRYFGAETNVVTRPDIAIHGPSCCSGYEEKCNELETVCTESGSKLVRICDLCF
jgi:hypothetical protein